MAIVYDENIKEVKYSIIDLNNKVLANIISNTVIEYNMVYNIFDDKVFGQLVFNDTDNISNLIPLIGDYKVKVYLQDKSNFQSYQTFNIVDVSLSIIEGRSNVVTFLLVDEYYFAFSRTNLVSSAANCKIEDIVNKYTKLLDPTILNKKEIVFKTTKKYESLIVTANYNFQEFLDYREIVDKINIYKTKNQIIFNDNKDIEKNCIDKSDIIVFKPEHPLSLNPLKIYDCDISIVNRLENLSNNPNRNDFFFNPLNKTVKNNWQANSYASMVKHMTNNKGTLITANDCIGMTNHVRIMDGNKTPTIDSDKSLLQNYVVELTIKGSIQIDIGQIVGLQLNIPGTNVENKIVTGKWMVSRLSEKIVGMCYVQKVQLINAIVEHKLFKDNSK